MLDTFKDVIRPLIKFKSTFLDTIAVIAQSQVLTILLITDKHCKIIRPFVELQMTGM